MPQTPVAPWRDVPQAAATVLRPHVDAITEDIIEAVRAEVSEYDQPLEGEFGHLISQGVAIALKQFNELVGTDAAFPATDIYAAMGRAELDAGRTLDALQSAYRTGARVAWRRVVADAGDVLDPHTMYLLAEAIFAYIDRLADASVAGYTEALAAREGSVHARRQALTEQLLADPASADGVRDAAIAAGWPMPETAAVVALEHEDPVALARRAPEVTLAARTEGGALLIVPDPDGPGRPRMLAAALAGVASAIGPTVALARLRTSAVRARRTLAVVRPQDGPVRADEHRLELLLEGDHDLVGELVDARLAPFAGLTAAGRQRAYETLRAWLDAHGDVSVAAERLHVHPQTVRYRLAGLRELLGDQALEDPRHRLELALALLAAARDARA